MVHTALCVGASPAARKSQSFVDFDENCYYVPDLDISTFKRSFYSFSHADRSKHCFMRQTSPAARNPQSFVDFDENCYFVPD
jgi:hypothetical protein